GARVPGAQPADRVGDGEAQGQGARRQAVLSAWPGRQGRPHQGRHRRRRGCQGGREGRCGCRRRVSPFGSRLKKKPAERSAGFLLFRDARAHSSRCGTCRKLPCTKSTPQAKSSDVLVASSTHSAMVCRFMSCACWQISATFFWLSECCGRSAMWLRSI